MDQFLHFDEALNKRITYNNKLKLDPSFAPGQRSTLQSAWKYTLPLLDALILSIKENRHPYLMIASTEQKHLVPVTDGLLLFVPSNEDRSYRRERDEVYNRNGDEKREIIFGKFKQQVLWKWSDGAGACIDEICAQLIEFNNTIARVFSVVGKNVSLKVNNDHKRRCLAADTVHFIRLARFATLGRFCHYNKSATKPVTLNMYQYVVVNLFPVSFLCRGRFYTETDAKMWLTAQPKDLIKYKKLEDCDYEYISSARYYLTDDSMDLFTGGSVFIAFKETEVTNARTSSWDHFNNSDVLPTLPDMNEEDDSNQSLNKYVDNRTTEEQSTSVSEIADWERTVKK